MPTCAKCAREIPEAGAACGHCTGENIVAAPAPVPVTSSVPASPVADVSAQAPAQATAAAPAAPSRKGIDRRVILGVLIVAMAGGTLTVALQMNSGAPTPAVVSTALPTLTRSPATAPPAPAAAPAASATTVVTPTWNHAERAWLWNPKKGVAFELPSLNRVGVWQGEAQPMLVVRCESNKLQTFVFTASAIQMEAQDENHSVQLRFDGEPEQTERWADSSDHDALFAPDSAAFTRRVMAAQVLRFGYTPHNARHAVAEFHVTGLAEMLEPAAKQCGWKK